MNWTGFTKPWAVPTARKWARQFAIIFTVWTASGLFMAGQWYILMRGSRYPPSLKTVLIPTLLTRWIFALLTPAVLWLSARFPFRPGRWMKSVAWHLLGALGFLFVWVSIRLPLYPITDPRTGKQVGLSWQLYRDVILEDELYSIMIYGTIVAVSQLWGYYREYREREVRASRLEAELARAELKVLKMQMDPHFLFATLHSVSTLIHQDVEAADDLVASLSELLRINLDAADEQEVTLKREIDYFNVYVEVQRIRFGSRLAVDVAVDPKALDALVPNMILPALVENSIGRSMEESDRPGQVGIRSELRAGKLRIEINDDLPRKQGAEERCVETETGLANTRARLQHLYGESHYFSLGMKSGGGSCLALEIPLNIKPAEPEEQPAVQPLFEVN